MGSTRPSGLPLEPFLTALRRKARQNPGWKSKHRNGSVGTLGTFLGRGWYREGMRQEGIFSFQ